MKHHRKYEQIQPLKDFERALEDEMSVSTQFGLPLCVLVIMLEDGWDLESEDRAAGTLRVADFIARGEGSDLIVVLTNTGLESARVVERRVREALPKVSVGISEFNPDDTLPDLISRARRAAG